MPVLPSDVGVEARVDGDSFSETGRKPDVPGGQEQRDGFNSCGREKIDSRREPGEASG